MGRGIDYKCNNEEVLKNGGLLVIQTFLSEDKSEEIQIMGRCARQGQPGSYCLIMLLSPLKSLLKITSGCSTEEIFRKRRDDNIQKNEDLLKNIDGLIKKHQKSMVFKKAMKEKDTKKLNEIIVENHKLEIKPKKSRTLILIDATESMDKVIESLKKSLKNIFDTVSKKLKELSHIKQGIFQVQIPVALYRDYDCEHEILEFSGYSIAAEDLIKFLGKIETFGGVDIPEAVEIGLYYANQQTELTQVMLVGDANAKDINEVIRDREKFWQKEKWEEIYGPPTSWEEQVAKLAIKKIPVNAVFLKAKDDEKKDNFKDISEKTGGKYHSIEKSKLESNTKIFQDYLSPFILRDIDEELAEDFLEKNPGTISYL